MYLSNEERTKYKGILSNYKLIKAKVKVISVKLEYLKGNNTLDRYKEDLLSKELKEHRKFINSIDTGFKRLSNKEMQLIELRYLNNEKLTWFDIADILNLSEGYCRTKLHERCLIKIFNILINKKG